MTASGKIPLAFRMVWLVLGGLAPFPWIVWSPLTFAINLLAGGACSSAAFARGLATGKMGPARRAGLALLALAGGCLWTACVWAMLWRPGGG